MFSSQHRSFRTRLAVAAASIPLVLAAACGTSGGTSEGSEPDTSESPTSDAPATTEATTTTEADEMAMDVEEWAMAFCTSFETWLDGIAEAGDTVEESVVPGDIESGKQAIIGLFGDASDRTNTLIEEITAAGYPDITDGDLLVEDLLALFEAFDEAAIIAQSEAEALEVSNADEFQAETERLATQFEVEVGIVADEFSAIDVDYPSRELNAAIDESCTF